MEKVRQFNVYLRTDLIREVKHFAAEFEPPSSGTVVRPFAPEHWGVLEMIDGRAFGLQAPLPRSHREGLNALNPIQIT